MDRVYHPYVVGKKDLVIADFGANIGLTAYYFKDYAKRVLAVEPSKQHLSCLKDMIEHNGIKNIEVFPYAISNANGTQKFYHNDNATMYSLNPLVNKKDDFEEVQAVTVETFMKKANVDHIDLLKFDIEGFESEVVVSEGFKSVADKIDVILGEWHSWTSMNQMLFKSAFVDLGFEFKWLGNTEASVYVAKRR